MCLSISVNLININHFSYLQSRTKGLISAISMLLILRYWPLMDAESVSPLSPVCRLPVAEDPGPHLPAVGSVCRHLPVLASCRAQGGTIPGHLRTPPSENKYHHRIYWHQDWVSRCFTNKQNAACCPKCNCRYVDKIWIEWTWCPFLWLF